MLFTKHTKQKFKITSNINLLQITHVTFEEMIELETLFQ